MVARYDRSQLLAHAVIRQAVLDLFSRTLSGTAIELEPYERHLAMRFLTATGDDDWAHTRAHWCSIADVDPDDLRMHIVDALEGHRDIEFPDDDKTYRLNGHDIARALWEQEKARHVAYLDRARQVVDARREQQRNRRHVERMRQACDEAGRIIDEANNRLRFGT